MKLSAYILMAACAALPAGAQTLSTEVVVDRTIEPAQSAASRPDALSPKIVLPSVSFDPLATAGYTGYGAVTRDYSPLAPASEPGFEPLSTYRGYASVGYFPLFNLGVSAGYRLIATERTRLSVWGQYDGESFKATDDAWRQIHNGGRVGVDLNQSFGKTSHLLARLSGGYERYKSGFYGSQSLGTGNLSVTWLSKAGPIHYKVGVKGALDSYGDVAPITLPDRKQDGISQKCFGFEAAGAYSINQNSRAGLDVDGSWLASSQGAPTLGFVGVTPFYMWQSAQFTARLGACIDFTTGGDSEVNVAPKVTIAWNPSGIFTIYGTATGGSQLNPVSNLRQYSPYIVGRTALARSEIPVDALVGFNVGPFNGLTVGIFGAYAIANDWIMPSEPSFAQLASCDIKGFRGGVSISYSFRSLVKVGASAEFAQSGNDKGWYQWRDRADKVIKANAEVTPIEKLKVNLDYEFRAGRSVPGPAEASIGLGCASNLGIGATYAISSELSVFARGENLLSRRYLLLPGVENQGVHGLVGAGFKF